MVHRTSEKATIVKTLLSAISINESVVAVKPRTSSEIRWSGLAIAPEALRRRYIVSICEVAAHNPASHGVAPQKPEPFLAETSDHRHNGQCREDGNINKSLPDETEYVAIGDRGHEIATDIAVDDVERIRGAEEHDQRGENELGFPANLGLRKCTDRPDKTSAGCLQRNGLRFHELSLADSLMLRRPNSLLRRSEHGYR
jgi:hypothetical protein